MNQPLKRTADAKGKENNRGSLNIDKKIQSKERMKRRQGFNKVESPSNISISQKNPRKTRTSTEYLESSSHNLRNFHLYQQQKDRQIAGRKISGKSQADSQNGNSCKYFYYPPKAPRQTKNSFSKESGQSKKNKSAKGGPIDLNFGIRPNQSSVYLKSGKGQAHKDLSTSGFLTHRSTKKMSQRDIQRVEKEEQSIIIEIKSESDIQEMAVRQILPLKKNEKPIDYLHIIASLAGSLKQANIEKQKYAYQLHESQKQMKIMKDVQEQLTKQKTDLIKCLEEKGKSIEECEKKLDICQKEKNNLEKKFNQQRRDALQAKNNLELERKRVQQLKKQLIQQKEKMSQLRNQKKQMQSILVLSQIESKATKQSEDGTLLNLNLKVNQLEKESKNLKTRKLSLIERKFNQTNKLAGKDQQSIKEKDRTIVQFEKKVIKGKDLSINTAQNDSILSQLQKELQVLRYKWKLGEEQKNKALKIKNELQRENKQLLQTYSNGFSGLHSQNQQLQHQIGSLKDQVIKKEKQFQILSNRMTEWKKMCQLLFMTVEKYLALEVRREITEKYRQIRFKSCSQNQLG